jgi:hypothetical protein
MAKARLQSRHLCALLGSSVCLIGIIWFASASMTTANAQGSDCTYGPDTCKQGFVWREADERDHVCVTPEVRERTREENERKTP